jgi:hypothetical protein
VVSVSPELRVTVHAHRFGSFGKELKNDTIEH